MGAENSLSLQQRQALELTLSPQQRQALEILQAPLVELRARLTQAAEQNPMLELDSHGLELAVGDPISNSLEREDRQEERELDPDECALNRLAGSDEWLNFLPLPGGDGSDRAEQSRRHDFAVNSVTPGQSQQEYLLDQLRFLELTPEVSRAAELVIGNLDRRGFLTAAAEEIAREADCSAAEAKEAIGVVQSLEPPGIAAGNLSESLLIQLDRRGIEDEILRRLIAHHLDDLARNQLPQLARHFRITLDELKSKLAILKTLDRQPGAGIEDIPEPAIVPEFNVVRRGGNLVIVDNPGVLPQLRLSTDYDDILENTSAEPEVRRFLTHRRQEARQLIRCLSQRETTLRRITEILVSEQYDFFMRGSKSLRPLTMARVADKLGLHETTISRAAAGKYLGTPFGVFEYKYFFSGGYTSSGGEQLAAGGIKEKVRAMIAAENRKKPLSDDKIAQMLKDEGLTVARRTVAKYRESLDIPPSNLRREF